MDPFAKPKFADADLSALEVDTKDDEDSAKEHPNDSMIVKLVALFPPVSVRYPPLIKTVYSPASACEDATEEIGGTVIVHEFLPFTSKVRQSKV